jgi:D-arabinose 1-dehydrogenase-like Zn-dependent alcohol dehydrogenase
VGVGAQSLSCGDCDCCLSGDENLCSQGLLGNGGTYNGHYLTGEKTYGGYADRWSGDGRFVFNIPVSMTNEMAATFLCAGVTTYAPLKRYNIGPGDRVGVIGLGGLGHFAVQWIKAMGAEAVVLSHSNRKIEDAIELGCDDYIVSHNVDAMRKNKSTMTHIICTSFANSFDWSLFLNLLKVNGRLILCAIPETPLSGIPPMLLSAKQLRISGTIIGSPRMIEDMLRFAARTHVQPWVNTYSMKDCPASVQAIRDGKPRYRIVLANDN